MNVELQVWRNLAKFIAGNKMFIHFTYLLLLGQRTCSHKMSPNKHLYAK